MPEQPGTPESGATDLAAATLAPGMAPAEPYHRLDPEGRPLRDDAREIVEPHAESRTLEVWARLRPDSFTQFFAYLRGLFDPERGCLSPAERRLIATVVSAENRCTGCVLFNERALGDAIDDQERARRLAINYRSVALSPRERAMADIAVLMTREPYAVEDRHIDQLRAAGLGEDAILEVIELVAAFNFTNRVSAAVGGRPNPEFFQAG